MDATSKIKHPEAEANGQSRNRTGRQRRRRKQQYKGRKDRLRCQNSQLKQSIQEALQAKLMLEKRESKLKREKALLVRKCQLIAKTATISATRASEGIPLQPVHSMRGVRKLARTDLNINDECIGRGVFGKCYVGIVAHITVCVKAFRKQYESAFPAEVHILSQCSHENLPWLYGVVEEEGTPRIIVMSFHGISGKAYTLHRLLKHQDTPPVPLFPEQFKIILLGLMSAIKYLHENSIIHNDIKSDNVVAESTSLGIKGVLIDLGKACHVSESKKYSLSKEDKHKYTTYHPQIAPDLRNGCCSQSFASDIYSVGRILKEVNTLMLKVPVLNPFSDLCTSYKSSERPTTADAYTFLHNLFG